MASANTPGTTGLPKRSKDRISYVESLPFKSNAVNTWFTIWRNPNHFYLRSKPFDFVSSLRMGPLKLTPAMLWVSHECCDIVFVPSSNSLLLARCTHREFKFNARKLLLLIFDNDGLDVFILWRSNFIINNQSIFFIFFNDDLDGTHISSSTATVITNPQESNKLTSKHTNGTRQEASNYTEESRNDEESKGLVKQASESMSGMVMVMMATMSRLAVFMMHTRWTTPVTTPVAKLATATFALSLDPTFGGMSTCLGGFEHGLDTSSDNGS